MSETNASDDVNGIAANQLRQFVERIERLEEEKKALGEDIKEVYSEAKGRGFDTTILRKVIALRKKDQDEVSEEEALMDVYLRALGMRPDFESADPKPPFEEKIDDAADKEASGVTLDRNSRKWVIRIGNAEPPKLLTDADGSVLLFDTYMDASRAMDDAIKSDRLVVP